MLFRFDQFEFDEARYELRRVSGTDRVVVELQPKVTEVLLDLLHHGGETRTKDEILDAVWGDLSITEASLTRCISVARRALGEQEGEAQIIQTVRGRGYRMGVPVERVEAKAAAAPAPAPSVEDAESGQRSAPAPRPSHEPDSGRTSSTSRPWLRWLMVSFALGAGALMFLARPFVFGASDLVGQEQARPPSVAHPATAVAVLPFADHRSADLRSVVADGLAMEVMDDLGRWPELQVTSLRSAFRFAPGEEQDPVEVGSVLGVGSLVTGSIRHATPEELRLHLSVVDTDTGFQRWSQTTRVSAAHLESNASEIADEVGRALGLSVDAMNPLRRSAAFVEARRRYQLGRLAVFEADREALLRAVQTYESALEIEPEPVPSYVALAEVYHRLWEIDDELGRDAGSWLASAAAVIQEGLRRDPHDPDALTVSGTVQLARRNWADAEADFRLALEHHGGSISSQRLAVLLMLRGRVEEARPHIHRALRLDPVAGPVLRSAGRFHLFADEPERAIPYLRLAIELNPTDPWSPRLLGNAYQRSGNQAAAREALLQIVPGFVRPLARIQVRLLGEERSIRQLIALDAAISGEPCRRDAYGTAMMLAHLGDRDPMLACLREASERFIWYTVVEPVFRPYHDDPEFRAIVESAGFGPERGWSSLVRQ